MIDGSGDSLFLSRTHTSLLVRQQRGIPCSSAMRARSTCLAWMLLSRSLIIIDFGGTNYILSPYVDRNALSLKQLEAKFFILWGNLLELKEELTPKGVQFPLPSNDPRLKNMPFECCIWEYGDKIKPTPAWPLGYQRMLKLMHTTIKN